MQCTSGGDDLQEFIVNFGSLISNQDIIQDSSLIGMVLVESVIHYQH